MFLIKLFYHLKPFIPRPLQISLRRQIAFKKIRSNHFHWPIDPNASTPPNNWRGWPNKKRFALILQHDVDTKYGHEKCFELMDLEQSLEIRSLYSFVPEKYNVSELLLNRLVNHGFEISVHGLKHDGKLFLSRRLFEKRAIKINQYLKEWGSVGFTSPSMHHNFDWMHVLNIKYCTSSFDVDPFEPQSDGISTIFPFYVKKNKHKNGFIEIPYTLPQDHLLFIILREKNIDIWKRKIDWIAENGGMAVLNTHPDYMCFSGKCHREEYPIKYYFEFIEYIREYYKDQYWHVLPSDMATFYRNYQLLKN